MQSYPARALDRKLQVDWARYAREGPRVLMSLRVLPIQLNLFPTTHIKYPLSACEITKLPLIQKLV